MTEKQEYTVRIGDVYGFAQGVNLPAMFKRRTPIEYPLVNADPVFYFGPRKLRQFSCTLTLYGTNEAILKQLESINDKVVPFICVYIGSFQAVIEMTDGPIDGSPGVWKTKIAVQEVV
jgi:hypothetical protein